MKNRIKKCIVSTLFALTAVTLAACNTVAAESPFDLTLPWHDDLSVARTGSYEKLSYAVTVYDTTQGVAEDKRTAIAEGTMYFELSESLASENTTLDMRFSVTYNAAAPASDRNLTDIISSTVRFSTGSLSAQYMTKTVTLADRSNTTNLSYEITADYHGTHQATYTDKSGNKKTLDLSKDLCRDNEMMFYLARATALAPESSNMFRLINAYESFAVGSITEYTLYAQTSADKVSVELGELGKACGVTPYTDEATGEVTYPVTCYNVNIGMSGTTSGPPYAVLYTELPLTIGNKSHAKVPVKIGYSEYRNAEAYRYTEYKLTSCEFEKASA